MLSVTPNPAYPMDAFCWKMGKQITSDHETLQLIESASQLPSAPNVIMWSQGQHDSCNFKEGL